MPFCPNPECRHKIRFGEPAEFLPGVTHCNDCGSPLSGARPDLPPGTKSKTVNTADVWKRLFLTILLLAFWRVLAHMSAPGIDYDALDQVPVPWIESFRVSLLSLGLAPFIAACVLVEICALFLQPLRSWRAGGYSGRAKLLKAALGVTLVLALFQGLVIAESFERLSTWPPVVAEPGLVFRMTLMITLAAGTFLLIWIADMISARGIGHGISLLIFTNYAAGLPHSVKTMVDAYHGSNPLKHYLGIILMVVALVGVIIVVERTYRRINVKFNDGREAYLPMKLTTAGAVPITWAATVVFVPATIAGFTAVGSFWQRAATAMSPGTPGYYAATILLVIFFSYLFSSLFYGTKSLADYLKTRAAQIVEAGEREAGMISLSLKRNMMSLASTLYLILFVLLADFTRNLVHAPLHGLTMIVSTVIALDLVAEFRLRRYAGRLTKVAEFQTPAEAGLLRSLLKQHKIPCQLRGYYHRSLLYFFGPYIEISAFVPEARAAEASDVIARYLKPA